MKSSWKLGDAFGIDVFVHWSFFLVPIIVVSSAINAQHGLWNTLLLLAFTICVFGCVILHEFGHALTARFFGIETKDITLLALGGLARLEGMPRKPLQEFMISAAGPAVNLAIAGFLFASLMMWIGVRAIMPLSDLGLVGFGFFFYLMVANGALFAFNLLPAFPMDGGRILRSLLACFLPYQSATAITVRIAQFISVLFLLFGIVSGIWSLVIIAIFVFVAADAELRGLRAASVQFTRKQGYQLDGKNQVDLSTGIYFVATDERIPPDTQTPGVFVIEPEITALPEANSNRVNSSNVDSGHPHSD